MNTIFLCVVCFMRIYGGCENGLKSATRVTLLDIWNSLKEVCYLVPSILMRYGGKVEVRVNIHRKLEGISILFTFSKFSEQRYVMRCTSNLLKPICDTEISKNNHIYSLGSHYMRLDVRTVNTNGSNTMVI